MNEVVLAKTLKSRLPITSAVKYGDFHVRENINESFKSQTTIIATKIHRYNKGKQMKCKITIK
jgi:replication-associated recombination protein RarA